LLLSHVIAFYLLIIYLLFFFNKISFVGLIARLRTYYICKGNLIYTNFLRKISFYGSFSSAVYTIRRLMDQRQLRKLHQACKTRT